MKKIDLHIHTVSTFSDRAFIFSLEAFKRYVTDAKLDAVAVTNHDVFDGVQFRQIQKELTATVFPGIEVNVDSGHLLVIARPSDLEDFASRTELVSKRIFTSFLPATARGRPRWTISTRWAPPGESLPTR